MKTFAIYLNGRHLDNQMGWTNHGALSCFLEDNPMYIGSNLETMELYVP